MKSLIEIGVVALVVGGMSAAGSFYWQQQLRKTAAAEALTAAAAAAVETKAADPKPEALATTEVIPESMSEDPVTHVETLKPLTDILPGNMASNTSGKPSSHASEFGPPVAARPPFNPTADEAGELINRLRARAAMASRQERRVVEREDVMKLIIDDLRLEQANSTKMRQRIFEETNRSLRAVDEARRQTDSDRLAIQNEQVETRRNADEQVQEIRREKDEAALSAEKALKAVREEQEEMKRQLEELRKPGGRDKSGSPEETANLKKMVGVVDSMPPEDTAKILQELVEQGKIDAVVAVLDTMKPRQSAKVLSAITENDPILAADLVDRLKKLKKAATPSPEPAK